LTMCFETSTMRLVRKKTSGACECHSSDRRDIFYHGYIYDKMQDGSFSLENIGCIPWSVAIDADFPRSLLVLNRWMSSSVGLYSKPNMSLGSFRT
jgi:hypothetical protein